MHRVLQVHQAVPKQCTHMQTNTQHPWNTNRGGGGQQRGWNHSGAHWSCSALYVACPPEHTTQGPVGRGGILPKNNTKDSQAPPLDNTIAPWFDDPSRRERNWFFFSFFTPHVSQGSVSIQLNVDVWEALKTQQSTRHWSLTSCNYTVLRLHCSDWMTLFPVKING